MSPCLWPSDEMLPTPKRLNALHNSGFSKPNLSLIGRIPDFIKEAFRAFHDRYPFIRPDAFSAPNALTAGDVGVKIRLLDGRMAIDIRVDQINSQIEGLQTAEEIAFAIDCVVIANSLVSKSAEPPAYGQSLLRLNTWHSLEGGKEAAQACLAATGATLGSIDAKGFGATSAIVHPKIVLENTNDRWKFSLSAENSLVPNTDLYLYREYTFFEGSKYPTYEDQITFLRGSHKPICAWLGLPADENE